MTTKLGKWHKETGPYADGYYVRDVVIKERKKENFHGKPKIYIYTYEREDHKTREGGVVQGQRKLVRSEPA